jgi:transcriptional regulator with XRE-family HTH domain
MTEHERARAWRDSMSLSPKQLSDLTGYSVPAIRLFESGRNTKKEAHNPDAWRRYKLACLAVMFMREYQLNPDVWEWTC